MAVNEAEESRFWIDDNPLEKPFGENTYGIVDEIAGGIVVYVGSETLARCLLGGFFES